MHFTCHLSGSYFLAQLLNGTQSRCSLEVRAPHAGRGPWIYCPEVGGSFYFFKTAKVGRVEEEMKQIESDPQTSAPRPSSLPWVTSVAHSCALGAQLCSRCGCCLQRVWRQPSLHFSCDYGRPRIVGSPPPHRWPSLPALLNPLPEPLALWAQQGLHPTSSRPAPVGRGHERGGLDNA